MDNGRTTRYFAGMSSSATPPEAASVATPVFDPLPQLVAELKLPAAGIAAVVKLMAEGATVPFIRAM